jgi:hypothetical protein
MTEAEWNSCSRPDRMLLFLWSRRAASDRKLRLFACGWCRTYADLLVAEGLRAVDVSELYADGLADEAEVRTAREAAKRPDLTTGNAEHLRIPEVQWAMRAAVLVAWGKANSWRAIRQVADYVHGNWDGDWRKAGEWASWVRDIFGPLPFHHLAIPDAWVTSNGGTERRLAESIYALQAWEELPILADALEESGCHDAVILGHCRGPGPHARGCWVLDLLLDKE